MCLSIAIDGPAGAGKSTIAKMVAAKLGVVYVDTGAMYRAVALYCQRRRLELHKVEEIEKELNQMDIHIEYSKGIQKIFLNGEDVTEVIRTQEVARGASMVAAVKAVRLKLVELQRKLGAKGSVVMDGRDIGTFVLPDATLKIFLTASVEERAKRRCHELQMKGISYEFCKIKQEIEERDINDSNREFAPLKKAVDAIEIDTTSLSIEEAAERIISLIPKEAVFI